MRRSTESCAKQTLRALQGYAAVGYSAAVGHCTESEENIDFLKSNNPTVERDLPKIL